MKRCPQCRRDYYDETLLYCLDDGTRLLDGRADTRTTAILPSASFPSETKDKDSKHRSRPDVPKSIAVLPFLDLSANADNEYFCDGLAEELLNMLVRIDGLKVAARTSAFSFKGKNISISEIASALNVSTVLEGSVRKFQDQLRVTVQLINAADGYHLWSERYDRNMNDVFALQDEIAIAVMEALKLKLFRSDRSATMKRYTENTEAYELYLKGRHCLNSDFLNSGTQGQLQKAIDFFNAAINIEPNYAPAFAGLAKTYTALSKAEETPVPSAELMPRAKEAAQKALELDDGLPEAHMALAGVLCNFEYNFAGAEREFDAARKIAPNDAPILMGYAGMLCCVGRFDEADCMYRRALEIDPLAFDAKLKYCQFLLLARRYDESSAEIKKVEELQPGMPRTNMVSAAIHELKGEHNEFIDDIVRLVERYESAKDAALIRKTFAEGGWPAFSKLRLERTKNMVGFPASDLATLYASVGEIDLAFAELEKAYQARESGLVHLKVDPMFDNLRDDPRYQVMLEKIGFPADLKK